MEKNSQSTPHKDNNLAQQADTPQETMGEEPVSANPLKVLGWRLGGQPPQTPPKLTPEKILTLQRSVGNQAVLRLLKHTKAATLKSPSTSPGNLTTLPAITQAPPIQRVWKKTKNAVTVEGFEYYNDNEEEYIHYIDLDSRPQRLLVLHRERLWGILFIREPDSDYKEWFIEGETLAGAALNRLLSEIEKNSSNDNESQKELKGEEEPFGSLSKIKGEKEPLSLKKEPGKGFTSPGEEKKSLLIPGEEKKSSFPLTTSTSTSKQPKISPQPRSQGKPPIKSSSSVITSPGKGKGESEKEGLSPIFFVHIFQGEKSGETHKGLHSRLFILSGKLKVDFFRRSKPDAKGVYAAEVTIKGYKYPKCSMFFPDDWDEQTIKMAVTEAFSNRRTKPIPTLSFYGFSTTCNMFIGGLSKKGSECKTLAEVDTAYPMYDGNMYNPNQLEGLIDENPDKTMSTTGEDAPETKTEPIQTPRGKSVLNTNQSIIKEEKKEKKEKEPISPVLRPPAKTPVKSISLGETKSTSSPKPRILLPGESDSPPLSPIKREGGPGSKATGGQVRISPAPITNRPAKGLNTPAPVIYQTTTSSPLETESKSMGIKQSSLLPTQSGNSSLTPNQTPLSSELTKNQRRNQRKALGLQPPLSPLSSLPPAPQSSSNMPGFSSTTSFGPSYSSNTSFVPSYSSNTSFGPGISISPYLPQSFPDEEDLYEEDVYVEEKKGRVEEKKERKESFREKKGEEKKEEKRSGTWSKTTNAFEDGPDYLNEDYTQYVETGGEQEQLLLVGADRSFALLYTRNNPDETWEYDKDIGEDEGLLDLLKVVDGDTGETEGEETDFFPEKKSKRILNLDLKEKDLKEEARKKKIEPAEEKTYINLRRIGFEMEDIADPGHHGEGADFIVKSADKVWIVEAKGSTGGWTNIRNLTFASGPHVPARQIASGINRAQQKVFEILKLPLSERIDNERILLVVTNLKATDAMMAVITCQAKFNNMVVAKHPVLLGEVINFIKDFGEGPEKITSMLFGKIGQQKGKEIFPDYKLEQIGLLYAKNGEEEATNQIKKIIEGAFITEWKVALTAKNLDRAIYDYLETAYNLARLQKDHDILTGGQQGDNPLATKKLATIKADVEKDGRINGKYYIHLQPVLGKIPGLD